MATSRDISDTEFASQVKQKWEGIARSSWPEELFGGTGYLTYGYYNSEDDTHAETLVNMTRHMSDKSGITSKAHVLDLGCGSGRPLLDIAVRFGCSVVGVDLAEEHNNMATKALQMYQDKTPDLKAEFHAASYFELPGAVTKQQFTHVMMQTSLFFAHHRIDKLLQTVSDLLLPGGVFVATDFYRGGLASEEEVEQFIMWNNVKYFLSVEELKSALQRNGFQFGEQSECLDTHFIRSCRAKVVEIERKNIQGIPAEAFLKRGSFAEEGKMTFQLVVANKT